MLPVRTEYRELRCKHCGSGNVIRYGTLKDVQRFWCKDCEHKFVDNDALSGMRTDTKQISSALNMYYEGMSLNAIRRHLYQTDHNYPSDSTVFEWVNQFSKEAVTEAKKYHPKVGNTWVADESYVRVDQNRANTENPYSMSKKAKWIIFWDIIDADTRFLLASHCTTTRSTKDAQALIQKAVDRAGKTPKMIVTDGLTSYLDGIELVCGADTKHKQSKPFTIGNDNNLIERFHSTLKSRTKVMRALKNKDTLKEFTDGWLVHYNFFRPHMSLGDKTPAQIAGINFPYQNWHNFIEKKPHSETPKVRIVAQEPVSLNSKVRVYTEPPRPPRVTPPMPRITPKTPRITPKTPSLKWKPQKGVIYKRGLMVSRHPFPKARKIRITPQFRRLR